GPSAWRGSGASVTPLRIETEPFRLLRQYRDTFSRTIPVWKGSANSTQVCQTSPSQLRMPRVVGSGRLEGVGDAQKLDIGTRAGHDLHTHRQPRGGEAGRNRDRRAPGGRDQAQ